MPLSANQPGSWWKRFGRWAGLAGALALVLGMAWLVGDEVQTSRWQAAWLSGRVAGLQPVLEAGPNPGFRAPGAGPFDQRLGYHRLPQQVQRLTEQGFAVTAQARMAPRMVEFIDAGLFAPYREKTQAGLDLRDCRGQLLAATRYPQRVYQRFEAVPPLLVDALLFIENRELLDPRFPQRNPAIEWDRLTKAVADRALRWLDPSHAAAGGSTLATQIEKYRHSPEGRTDAPSEKLRQMASASLRAYLDGDNTLARRRQIVVDYLDTVPLSAQAGFGEINGIGDGLWAWYGRDFDALNRLLVAGSVPGDPAPQALQRQAQAQALAFKQALSLLIAQRRPSYYLDPGQPALRRLTDSHLRVLAAAGVISPALRDAALPLALALQGHQATPQTGTFIERKAVNATRAKLQSLLATPRAYDLDRLDLAVATPLDGEIQRAASTLLRSLGNRQAVQDAGLFGPFLLKPGDDTGKIMFSFTLYERGEHSNLLRVQTDSFDQPFDLNDGARLDLGSTAKLRTLVTYLEMVAALHARWQALSAGQLAALPIGPQDALGRWARGHLAQASDKGLAAMLDAALERRYSASPHEGFFTGGGLHHFENFEPADNGRSISLREALTRSVNLVFIRLMRDLVQHVMAQGASQRSALWDDPQSPQRAQYLARFADKEGREFIARFHRRYAGKAAPDAEGLLAGSARATPARLAAAFYGFEPDAGPDRLAAFIRRRLPDADLSDTALQALRDKLGPGRWSLPDRGYLAGVHPLELWVAGHLRAHPEATLAQLLAASAAQRQEVYQWLFKTRHKGAQDARIRNLLEVDAFAEIHQAWRRLGYPFEAMTPSYASALGASGDRPAALAELMGIIVNRGLRLPVTRVASLQFARDTPYETRLVHRPGPSQPVLQPEIADVLRRALIGVVETGTAKRLKGALLRRDGSVVEIGGKTGTGDHRFDSHGRGGQLISSRVVNRSATLVFLIGERYFGTLMAYVHEPFAKDFQFTSALPTQLLRALLPALQPLVDGGGCGQAPADADPEAPQRKLLR